MNIAEFIAVIKVARGNKTFIQKKKIIYKNRKLFTSKTNIVLKDKVDIP